MFKDKANLKINIENIQKIYEEVCFFLKNEPDKIDVLKIITNYEKIRFVSSFNRKEKSLALLAVLNPPSNNNLQSYAVDSGFTIRNIENFGVYIFCGRPDLTPYQFYTKGLSLANAEDFKTGLEKFVELPFNLFRDIFEVEIKIVPHNILYNNCFKPSPNAFKNGDKKIPTALERVYKRKIMEKN